MCQVSENSGPLAEQKLLPGTVHFPPVTAKQTLCMTNSLPYAFRVMKLFYRVFVFSSFKK